LYYPITLLTNLSFIYWSVNIYYPMTNDPGSIEVQYSIVFEWLLCKLVWLTNLIFSTQLIYINDKLVSQDRLSLDNIYLRSNDSFVRVSFVRFVYRAFVRLSFPYSSFVSFRSFVPVSCVRFVYRAFASCIVRSFRVSCVFCIVRVKRSFVFRSFRLRFSFVCVLKI
jgi:hypothetical protein